MSTSWVDFPLDKLTAAAIPAPWPVTYNIKEYFFVKMISQAIYLLGTICILKFAIPYRPSYFSLLHEMFYPQQHIFLLLEDFLSLVEPYIHMEPIRVVVIKILLKSISRRKYLWKWFHEKSYAFWKYCIHNDYDSFIKEKLHTWKYLPVVGKIRML